MTACGLAVTLYVATEWGGIGIAVAVVLALCSLFFGATTVYLGVRLISTRPTLVVDANGIIDHTTPFGVGRVRWDEVVDAQVRDDTGAPFVSIEVADPQALVARQGPISRFVIRLNAKRWGVVVLNAAALDVGPGEVVEAVHAWLRWEGSGRS
jgi:hypothetical protein